MSWFKKDRLGHAFGDYSRFVSLIAVLSSIANRLSYSLNAAYLHLLPPLSFVADLSSDEDDSVSEFRVYIRDKEL